MKKTLHLRLIAIILGCLFIAFLVNNRHKTEIDMQEAVKQHAKIISSSLWDINKEAHAEYLSIVAKHYDYGIISVLDNDGEIFQTASAPFPPWYEKILLSLRLIPKVYLTTPVIYNGKKIGIINVTWYRKSIYTYSYILLVLLLGLSVIYFYNRILKSNIRLEAKVEERTKVLQESEKKYRLLADNAADVIWTTDTSLKTTFISPSIKELRGYTPEEAMAESFEKMLVSSFLEKAHDAFLKAAQSSTPIIFEGEQPCKDGSTVWVEMIVHNLFNDSGNRIGLIGTSRNITERKSAEKEKAELESQLFQAHKMEAIGTLAGGIAHDFNNILAAILGYTEMASDNTPDDSPAKYQLEQVLKAGNRAKELVKHILSFSRKEIQKHIPVPIYQIVKDALKLLRASIPATIELKQNIDPQCGNILADPTQIHQVLMNLCTNAAQSMDENGGVLEVGLISIQLSADDSINEPELKPGHYVQLTVKDSGMGIDQKNLDRIFDPYFTTKEVGKGSGMGLAVVIGIVKSHDGLIRVDSKPGKGTTFFVNFPRIKQQIQEEVKDTAPLPLGNENILIVDDEKSIVDMTKQRAERLGYLVTAKTSSMEALELFRSKPDAFDLIITDQTMPELTGEKLAMRLMEIRPDIPIIICTGYSSKMDAEKANSIGISAFIMKPVDIKEFAKTIRQVLDEKIS